MAEKKLTGYPSVDKPWLKYYSEEAICASVPECTIFEYLWQNNKDHLDEIALIYYDRKLTFRELFREIDKAANAYAALGVAAGDIVTFAVLACPETVISLYALNKIGAIPNMVNVLSSAEEYKHYINEANSKLFVCWSNFYATAGPILGQTTAKKTLLIDPLNYLPPVKRVLAKLKTHGKHSYGDGTIGWNQFLSAGATCKAEVLPFTANTPCVMAHTGGTTGEPKGVLLSNEAINAVALQYSSAYDHARQETYMDLIVPFVIYGIAVNIHMPLCMGLRSVLIPFFKPKEIPGFFLHYKPNIISSIPAYWTPLLSDKKARKADFSFIRIAGAGGDGMTVEIEEEMNAFLKAHGSKSVMLKGYGLSELCSTAVACFDKASKPGSVGIPQPLTLAKIVEPETEQEKRYGQIGEICICSPSLMLGYYRNNDATSEMVKEHADGRTWVHTGDLGYMDEDGFVFLTGRMRRIILTSYTEIPSKIFPDRIERVIMKHPAVFQCCVVSEPHPQYKAVTRAHIVPKPEYMGNYHELQEEINTLCHQNLPDYSCPFSYSFRESLPLTAVGKVDWIKLEEEGRSNKAP